MSVFIRVAKRVATTRKQQEVDKLSNSSRACKQWKYVTYTWYLVVRALRIRRVQQRAGFRSYFFFTVPVRYPLRRASVKGNECLSAKSVHEIYIPYNIYVLVRQDELLKAEGVTVILQLNCFLTSLWYILRYTICYIHILSVRMNWVQLGYILFCTICYIGSWSSG